MRNSILKETINNLNRFEDICNKQNENAFISEEERNFVAFFEFKLAESLLKELGDIATRTAKHILVN